MIMRELVLLVVTLVVGVHSYKNCCAEQSHLENGTCTDGSRIQLRTNCSGRFMLDPTVKVDRFIITENDTLVMLSFRDSQPIDNNSFCISKVDNRAVVCIDYPPAQSNFELRVVCGFVSVLFIILTIGVYCAIPRLRDLQGKCIMHSLLGLALAFFSLFLVQVLVALPTASCVFMAFAVYITFMVAFFWLNVVSINIWRTTVIPNLFKKTDSRWHMLYCIYGYGVPCIFLLATLTTHNVDGGHIKPGFGDGTCFFNGWVQYWAYFYGPVAVLLIVNTILFVWSSSKLWFDSQQQQNSPKLRNLKFKYLLTMKLFLIMGLLWIFEIISYATGNVHEYLDYMWVITDYINALQGVLIFLVLVVFRKKALRELANTRFFGTKCPRSWRTLEDEECSGDEFKEQTNGASTEMRT